MTTLTLTDIFFLITGSAVIIITMLLAIGLLYIIMFVRTAKQVMETAQKVTEGVHEDIKDLRNNIKERGFSVASMVGFAKNLVNLHSKRKK